MDSFGELLGIDSLVMGMTFSAAGTSFPNVFGSMVVARQGLGNAAVANALGGNVFNIFMGLGFPWLLYTLVGSYDVDSAKHSYYGMDAGGVVFPVLLLALLMLLHIVRMLTNDWKIVMIDGYVMVLIYIGFLIWVFGFGSAAPTFMDR